jgi:predicted flap endonuclease-1-like 5' DNA nuclease
MRRLLLALLLIFCGVSGLIFVLWLLDRNRKPAPVEIDLALPGPEPEPEPPGAEPAEAGEAQEPDEPQEPDEIQEPDDLTRIEGIGPKIAAVLQAAGIQTYARLAGAEVGRIEEILEAESPRLRGLADPSTWPEQAVLAASGDWEALEALQSTFHRGRRRP